MREREDVDTEDKDTGRRRDLGRETQKQGTRERGKGCRENEEGVKEIWGAAGGGMHVCVC